MYNFLDTSRNRLAMACSTGGRYWGLGGDKGVSLWSTSLVERAKEIEEDNFVRKRARCRATKDEH